MAKDDVIEYFLRNRDKRFALTGHQRPDGDSIGSVLGLASILNGAGFSARPVNLVPVPRKLQFLFGEAAPEPVLDGDWTNEFDCLVVLDCGDWDRLDAINQLARGRLEAVTIDHHVTSRGIGAAVWIEPSASSVGEMVVRLARRAGWEIPADAAQGLWTAILTDTGRFAYQNTTPAAMEAAGYCLTRGADPDRVSCELYQNVPRAERTIQTRALNRMEFFAEGRLAVTWIMRQDYRDAGCGSEGSQDMINLLRDTTGVEVAIFLSETSQTLDDGRPAVKASLRTADPFDAIAVASQFQGGGHRRAAGCTILLPIAEARDAIVRKALQEYFHADQ